MKQDFEGCHKILRLFPEIPLTMSLWFLQSSPQQTSLLRWHPVYLRQSPYPVGIFSNFSRLFVTIFCVTPVSSVETTSLFYFFAYYIRLLLNFSFLHYSLHLTPTLCFTRCQSPPFLLQLHILPRAGPRLTGCVTIECNYCCNYWHTKSIKNKFYYFFSLGNYNNKMQRSIFILFFLSFKSSYFF